MDVELGGFEESEAAFVPMDLEEWAKGGRYVSAKKMKEREWWAAQGLKRCSKCGEAKPHADFYRHKTTYDGFVASCSACNSANGARWRKTAYARLRNFKENRRRLCMLKEGRVCQQCGEDHMATLVFHHRDPRQKRFNLAVTIWHITPEIEAEIAKCDVLCANCHRKLHWHETDARFAELEEIDSHRERQLAMAGT